MKRKYEELYVTPLGNEPLRRTVLLLGFIFAFAISLSAQTSANAPELTIQSKGLQGIENAIYSVYYWDTTVKGEDKYVKVFTVAMNNVSNKAKAGDYAERTIILGASGRYKVTAEAWAWAYTPDKAETEIDLNDGEKKVVTVTETPEDADKLPKHAESSAANEARIITLSIEVNDWGDGGRKHFKF